MDRKIFSFLLKRHTDTSDWPDAVSVIFGPEKAEKFRSKEKATSKEDAMEDIKQVSTDINGRPTKDEYRKHGKYSASSVTALFNSWSNALSEAGFEPRAQGRGRTKYEYYIDLVRVAEKLGKQPSFEEYDEHGQYDYRQFMSHLGSKFQELSEEALKTAEIIGELNE